MISITHNMHTGEIEIRFHKDPTLLLLVKRIPNRSYHPDHYWRVPIEQGRDIKPYIDRFIAEAGTAGFESEVDPLVWDAIEEAANYKEKNYALSLAEDYTEDKRLTSAFGRDLTPLQRARVRYLFNNSAGVLFGSDDPLVPLIALEYALWFPALVVCPDPRKFEIGSQFRRMTRRQTFVVEDEPMLIREAREAATGKPQFAEMCICNFGNLPKYRMWLTTIDFQSLLIVDGQWIRSGSSGQVTILLDLARVIPHKILMTTTDFRVKPWELCAQLEVIGKIDQFGGRAKFLQDFTRQEWADTERTDGPQAVEPYKIWKPANTDRLEKELRSICYTR